MIATPSRIVGQGLAGIIDRLPDMSFAGTVEGMQSCIERMDAMAPDVLIVDSSFFVPLSRVRIYSAYPELQGKTVVCLVSNASADWLVRQFDGSISIYDDEERIGAQVARGDRELRHCSASRKQRDIRPRTRSSRAYRRRDDKQGDCRPAEHIGTYGYRPSQEYLAQDGNKVRRRTYGLCDDEQYARLPVGEVALCGSGLPLPRP